MLSTVTSIKVLTLVFLEGLILIIHSHLLRKNITEAFMRVYCLRRARLFKTEIKCVYNRNQLLAAKNHMKNSKYYFENSTKIDIIT